jgi:hypothetical protein
MKKLLLLALVFGMGYTTIAQQAYKFKIDTKEKKAVNAPAIGIEPLKSDAITKSHVDNAFATPTADRNTDIVTVIDIGTSANAYGYGYAGGQKNLVHCEPGLNVVTNFHRMGGDLDPDGYSGDLGYDISLDGGMTWTNMNECYVAVDNGGGEYFIDAARYPNHAVYNPTGNIEDAYVVFFAPNLDGSNSADSWGGYSFGVDNINMPADTTGNYNRKSSHGDYYQYIPDGYDLTEAGMSIAVDVNQDWSSGALVYMGSLIVNRGFWDEDAMDFLYEESLIDFPIVNEADQGKPAFVDVAFGPGGDVGYIVVLADNGDAEQQSGYLNFYPILLKTTDGGETWGDPMFVQLDGADGLNYVVNQMLTDQQIADLFEAPVPSREEISYTTAFDCDIAVDKNNNPHIAVVLGPTGSDPYSIISAETYTSAVDLFSMDGGTTWQVEEMGRPRTFRGTFGDLTEDNRIQITTTPARDKIFVTYLDTDLEEETDNQRPNLWCRGLDPFSSPYMLTANAAGEAAPTNVTNFSAGMWQAYFGTVAQMAFDNGDGSYTIPMTYEEMDPTDPAAAVQFKYITDFKFTAADWTITGIGDEFEANDNNTVVSQNYPNPFSGQSYVTVNLTNGSDLSLSVYTITGQQVISQDYGYKGAGTTTLTINGENLTSGVYFYTVTAGETKVTHKLVVE